MQFRFLRNKLCRSTVVTSNRVAQDWPNLGDNTAGIMILVRLMHRSTVQVFEGRSCRLMVATARAARDTSNN